MLHVQIQSHQLPQRGVVLQAIDWEIPQGALTVLVGPNGAGKSTLLRLLSGWERPSDGVVTWNGRSLIEYSPAELSKMRAFLPQEATRRVPALTVREIVALGCGREVTERDALIETAMEWMGLVKHAASSYSDLSGGEQQRVHIARCRVQLNAAYTQVITEGGEAPVLASLAWGVFDEPVQNLDLFYQKAMLSYWREWAKETQGTVVVSLHQLDLTGQYADSVLLLQNGKVLAKGAAGDVLQPEIVEQLYSLEDDD